MVERRTHITHEHPTSAKMAKRAADQQLTKDGTMSDEEGFSVGSQIGGPQRATAAQMAQRRYVEMLKFRVFMSGGRLQMFELPSHHHTTTTTTTNLSPHFHNTQKSTLTTSCIYNTHIRIRTPQKFPDGLQRVCERCNH